MKKEEADRKTRSFAFRIEYDIYERLVASSHKCAVPMTQIHRWALLEWLDEHSDDNQTIGPGYLSANERTSTSRNRAIEARLDSLEERAHKTEERLHKLERK